MNSDSTSREASFSFDLHGRRIRRKSSEELFWNFGGKYGDMSWFIALAVSYIGVGI